MSDIIIWLVIFFVFIIIIGLYISEYTPVQLNQKDKILSLQENFSPSVSSSSDQLEGASELYNWGLPDNDINDDKKIKSEDDDCDVPELIKNNIKKEKPKIETCDKKNVPPTCYNCDITINKDINKYVLKSSVPACPDMSKYITKNMINPPIDLNNYILKSEIKACEKIDTSQYILKSKIPPCPTCPVCPICPKCPVCPTYPVCKKLNEFNITQHPDISKYISKEEVDKNYIKKNNKLNSEDDHKRINDNGRKDDNDNGIRNNNDNGIKNDNRRKDDDYHFEEDKIENSELLNNNVMGFYAGDSLFAGV